MTLKTRNRKGNATRKMSSTFDWYSSFFFVLAFPSESLNFLDRFRFKQLFFFFQSSQAYPSKAPNTKIIQTIIQPAIAVIPSTFGELTMTNYKMNQELNCSSICNWNFMTKENLFSTIYFWALTLKILVSTRKSVISIAIRPGMISGGTRKLAHDTTTNNPDGR